MSQKNDTCSLRYLTLLTGKLILEHQTAECRVMHGSIWSGHDKGKNIRYLDRWELCDLGLPSMWHSFGGIRLE